MRRLIPILLAASCGAPPADGPPTAECPAPWKRPTDASKQLRDALGDVEPENIDACVVGFMGWSFVARFHADSFTPTLEGTAAPPERLDAQLEGLRKQLPTRCGAVEWKAVASGVVSADGNIDTRALFVGEPGEYLFVLDHAG